MALDALEYRESSTELHFPRIYFICIKLHEERIRLFLPVSCVLTMAVSPLHDHSKQCVCRSRTFHSFVYKLPVKLRSFFFIGIVITDDVVLYFNLVSLDF